MSTDFTPLTKETHDYWVALMRPEDEFLAALQREAEVAGIPAISVSPLQGALLTWLARFMKARRIVEVGTLAGYSALCLARGQGEDGRLVTCEFEAKHADFSEMKFAQAKLSHRMTVLRGPAMNHLPGMAAGDADLVFIDADKANYGNYLEQSLRILRPGGVVAVDNANAFGLIADRTLQADHADFKNVEALRAFSRRFRDEPGLDPVFLPIGDGMLLGRKK